MESLELCTHWVMECFVAIHYTVRAFYVLGISIWGLGISCQQFPLRSYRFDFIEFSVRSRFAD